MMETKDGFHSKAKEYAIAKGAYSDALANPISLESSICLRNRLLIAKYNLGESLIDLFEHGLITIHL